MEVAARELIPALLAAAPAGMRFTAFINREAAAAGDGPWGETIPAVTVAGPAAGAARPRARAAAPQHGQHGAPVGAVHPRDHRPRSHLRALSRRPSRD